MPRSALQALLVASVVLLAGCTLPGQSTPDGGPAATPSPTDSQIAPSPTPTASPTPDNGAYPAGLTADGVRSPWDLAQAHASVLTETSYTVEETNVIRRADGSHVKRDDRTVRVGAEPHVYRYETSVREADSDEVYPSETPWTLQAHSNGTLVAQRVIDRSGNATVNVSRGSGGSPTPPVRYGHGSPLNQERVFVILSRANVSVSGPESGPYNLTASGFTGEELTVDGTTVANVSLESFTATVQSSGLVSEYRLVVTGTVGGEQVKATEHVVYSGVGSTDPEKPDWWDEAVSE